MNVFILQPKVFRENKASLRVNSSPIVNKFNAVSIENSCWW